MGGEVRAVFLDRIIAFVRPFVLDFGFGSFTGVRWDVLFGAGATF